MRLAVYHSLPSGGAKRALHESLRRLADTHELSIYTLSTANHDFCDVRPFAQRHEVYPFQPARLFASPFGRLNQWQRWRDLQRLRRLEQRMAADIDRAGYDVVYVQPSQWTQAPPLLHFLQTPSVYYIHEPPRMLYERELSGPRAQRGARGRLDAVDPLIGLYFSTLRRFDQLSTRRATRRLANSRFTAAAVERLYGCTAEVSYFGVDTETFHPAPGAERTGVLSVGALRRSKGFDFLVQALGEIPAAARPPLRLIANEVDAEERAYLEALAAERQVAVTIEVMVSPARLVQAYQQAALFVYAPVAEPLGLAALEAMACGTPVVAVAEGGLTETVTEGRGGRLTPRDPRAFAAAVQALLADARQREYLGQQARAEVETRWTWDASVRQLAQHLSAVQGMRPAPQAQA